MASIRLGAVVAGVLVIVTVSVALNSLGQASVRVLADALGVTLAVAVFSGFASCALGGFVAGRLAERAGGANGVIAVLASLIAGVTLVLVLMIGVTVMAFLSAVPDDSVPLRSVPYVPPGPLLATPAYLLAGYVGGKRGERPGAPVT